MDAASSLTLVPDTGLEHVRLDAASDAQYVGRSSRCRVRLPETARCVSRLHAQFTCRDRHWYVIDVSRRGTFVDGLRIPPGQPVHVRHGQQLRFGECSFTVQLAEAERGSDTLEASYEVAVTNVDLSAINSARILRSALELPEHLGQTTSENAMYDVACAYLVEALAPVIAGAYVVVFDPSGTIELLGHAERSDSAARGGAEPIEPVFSRRMLERLQGAPATVLFLHRHLHDAASSATLPNAALAIGASLLETDARDRPTLLYTVSDRILSSGQELVAQYLRLIATLVRQHALTLRRAHLARYFSPNLVKLLVQPGGSALLEAKPQLMPATSLFFDVRGSSRPYDASAEDLTRIHEDLSRIISMVTQAVFDYEGTVIDYAGDGVFAAWGVPRAQVDQSDLAVRCAIRIVEQMRNERFLALNEHSERPPCGIGIAKGEVLAGPMGCSAVLKYGILGPSVNTAQRLAVLTKPEHLDRPILVSAAVQADLAHAQRHAQSVGSMALPGIPGEIEVFEIRIA